MNLIISYTREQDAYLSDIGCKFLGAAKDKNVGEVHIFEHLSLNDYNKIQGVLSKEARETVMTLINSQAKRLQDYCNG